MQFNMEDFEMVGHCETSEGEICSGLKQRLRVSEKNTYM
jgi:hypothetical protein